jgi:predicted O-methyltransferase YrrM
VGRIVAKLIGSYEEELHAVLQDLLRDEPRTVVNIGSAEGYYAIGLARALPKARVHAFEVDAGRRALCGELARANGVEERVVVHGACNAVDLARLPEPGDLVVCDCEGYETEVLRPDVVPWLLGARLLVELHDAFVPGTRETLSARFAPTHTVRLVAEAPRDPRRHRALRHLTEEEAREALDEYRRDREARPLHMQWAVMTPRRS